MKTYLFLAFLFLLLFQISTAQTRRISLHWHTNFAVPGSKQVPGFSSNKKLDTFDGLSASIHVDSRKKRKYHAIELSKLRNARFTDTIFLFKEREFILCLRYEQGAIIPLASKLSLKLGGGLRFYYGYHETVPLVSWRFSVQNWSGGTVASFVGHFQYKLMDRLICDISPMISLANFGLEKTRENNPAFTRRQQESGFFELRILPETLLRVGLGYQF